MQKPLELILCDPALTGEQIQKSVYFASTNEFEVICCHSLYAAQVSAYIGNNQKMAILVDYPYGLTSLPMKLHAILEAQKKGAALIDLVINQNHIQNCNWKAIKEELKALDHSCKENGMNLRPIIEYRSIIPTGEDDKPMFYITKILEELGIYSLVLSSSYLPEDFHDVIIFAKFVQKKKLMPIINTYRMNQEEYDHLLSLGLYKIRFSNIEAAKHLKFGIYKEAENVK
jgi:hypothetical protein